MQLETLTKNIIACIEKLSDTEIVEIDAGRLGLTAFIHDSLVLPTPGLTQDNWRDNGVRSRWENMYGRGHYVTLFGAGEENVYEMACPDELFEESELDERLKDNVWVESYAMVSRGSMISHARESAELVMDYFSTIEE